MDETKKVGVEVEVNSEKAKKDSKEMVELIEKNIEVLEKLSSALDKNASAESRNASAQEENIAASKKLVNTVSNIAKKQTLTTLVNYAHAITRIARSVIKLNQYSVDYIENLNLMDSAFGKTSEDARKWVNSIAGIYGFDESALSKELGMFRQFGNALGFASDKADLLSKNLTLMVGDIASLYNISFDKASEKLTSALTGQTKAIRSLGADITQATLQQELYNMGINESISNMNRAEKTLLIYLTLERQLATAQGDLAKTLESPSNQMKVFTEQVHRLARAIGNSLLPILASILPVVNGIIMALTELFNLLATLLGYDETMFNFGGALVDIDDLGVGVGNVGDALDGVSDSAGKAGKSVDDLKKKLTGLRGFDKLNVIQTPTDTSSSGGSGGSGGGVGGLAGGGINSKLLDALDEYNAHLEQAGKKAQEIRDKIMEWLGFTKDTNGEWKFGKITLGGILTTIGLILGGLRILLPILRFIVGKDGLKLIKSLIGWISKSLAGKGILAALGTIGKVIGIIAVGILGIIRIIQGINDLIEGTKPKVIGIMKIIEGIALVVAAVAMALGGWIVAAIAAAVALVAWLTEIIITNWDKIKKFFIDTWAAISEFFKGLYEDCKKVLSDMWSAVSGFFSGIWEAISGFFIGIYQAFMDYVYTPIKTIILAIANFYYTYVIEPIINFFAPIVEAVVSVIKDIYSKVAEIVKGIITAVKTILSKVIEIVAKIVEILVALGKAFYTYVLKPIIDWLVKAAVWVYDNVIKPIFNFLISIPGWYYDNIIKPIINWLKKAATWVYENVIKPVYNKLKDIATWVYNNVIKKITNFFKSVGSWVYNNIMKPAYDKVIWLRDKAIEAFKKVSTKVSSFISGSVKGAVNGVLWLIENSINTFIRMLNGAIGIINKIPGVSISRVSLINIPRLAEGGFVENKGQLFVAREKGPELVGSIGNKTAVANNDQIVQADRKSVV